MPLVASLSGLVTAQAKGQFGLDGVEAAAAKRRSPRGSLGPGVGCFDRGRACLYRARPSAVRSRGVVRVYTPKDYQINDMMADIVSVVREANGRADHG